MVVIGDEGEYKCEGEYKEGFPHGQATVMFPNGDVYQGELGPKGIGKGTYTEYNGEVYMGYYLADWELSVYRRPCWSGGPVELRPDSGVDGGW